ncbi:hypothetical protein HE1_00678 [Holospora elegans E1]|uniref:Uncharacterized protein n=1 Tax=Holospora elegans E1 TaxID=1427503 RepID=A0A023DX50_9PROT|nr:hypothetical protein [Holospora elegans]GAJ45906.1 hypothetical protein HE1_00223 [Holospora elegans E1]GAJ46346.1 hypothetical protein HE1_00678 [Holospora elegans E1]
MNVKISLKAVLFEGAAVQIIKNVEKISRGMSEKDKLQVLVLYASVLSTNRSDQRFCVRASVVLK